jgi:glutaredoxin
VTDKLTAVIYSNGSQECERIGMLLKTLDGEYLEYLVDCDFSERQFRMEFGPEATYPQVAIGNKHIGGLKETLQYFKHNGVIQ